jgi:hypothetical protein
MQNLAHLLLTHTTGGSSDIDSLADAMERASNTLRLHLGKLMGIDGFSLLLVRSLTFARADFPWLKDIQAGKDGSLKGLDTTVRGQEPVEVLAGFTAVISHFLRLLVAFIGEDLTMRLIQGAWPEVDLGGKDLGTEEMT